MSEKKIKVISDDLGNGLEIVTTRIKRESFLDLREGFNSLDEIVKVVREYLAEWDREVFAVLNLTTSLQPINSNIVSIGEMNSTIAGTQEILKGSLLSNANTIMLFHCHPSGEAIPSEADVRTTESIIIPAVYMGLEVLDHVIVSGVSDEYFSFQQNHFFDGVEACVVPDVHPMVINYKLYLRRKPCRTFSMGGDIPAFSPYERRKQRIADAKEQKKAEISAILAADDDD